MEKPKIGVFICRCGEDIGGVLDVPALADYARTLPAVTFVQEDLKACSPGGVTRFATAIAEQRLNRVVLAACSPRTYGPLFRAACERAGLNPYLLEMVNLSDQCARVHANDPARAMDKARDLIRMGVASATYRQPLDPIALSVEPVALVIGAGVSGMTAALGLANRGIQVHLVEREPVMGGLLRGRHQLYPTGEDATAFVERQVEDITSHPNIQVWTSSEVRALDGRVGNYAAVVVQDGQEHPLTVGAVVAATGTREFTPDGLYGYDGARVITQGQLEGLLSQEGWLDRSAPRSVAMIQCVGARNEERHYCSRVCCMVAIKNALALKEAHPETQVFILYRDMLTLGHKYEALYSEARQRGVIFIQYGPEAPPQVSPNGVIVHDQLLGEDMIVESDLTILSTPLISQSDSGSVADLLDATVDENGFFLEPHLKHRPLDMTAKGIFQCGTARWPCDISESVMQAYGAVSRACLMLEQEHLEVPPVAAKVNVQKCIACGACEATCLYDAVAVKVVDPRRGTRAAQVDVAACQGCGACVAGCRSHAIDLSEDSNEHVLAAVMAF